MTAMATLAQVDLFQEGALIGLPMPLTLRPPAPLSDDQIMVLSRKNKPYQIERNAQGELEIMSPVGTEGSRWEAHVIRELGNWTEQNGGQYFSSNGGFTLPDGSMRSPDAAWVSDAVWNALSLRDRERFSPICPEFLIEILSVNDSRSTLEAKMQMWIQNGAQLAWMIDPFAETVSIYRPHEEVEVMERPDSVQADGTVAGFRLATAKLWDAR